MLSVSQSMLQINANGVPQGTVLSSILCLINVNELGHSSIHAGKLFSYAVDTVGIWT